MKQMLVRKPSGTVTMSVWCGHCHVLSATNKQNHLFNMTRLIFVLFLFFGATSLRSAFLLIISVSALGLDVS